VDTSFTVDKEIYGSFGTLPKGSMPSQVARVISAHLHIIAHMHRLCGYHGSLLLLEKLANPRKVYIANISLSYTVGHGFD